MEIEGHPTQDLLEELERRGAVRIAGSTAGPHTETTVFLAERYGDVDGLWIFLPPQTFQTGVDDPLV